MKFIDVNPDDNTKVTVEHYHFFPRRHLWLIGLLQRIGLINVHFYSDATTEYVEQVMDLYNTIGVKPTFGSFIAREDNPDYTTTRKKDLHVLKQSVAQKHNVDLQGFMMLVDDKKSKQVDGQAFYHIPKIDDNNPNDLEIVKMLFCMYSRSVAHDLRQSFKRL